MLPYCLKCRKNTESKNSRMAKDKVKLILSSICAVCDYDNEKQDLLKIKKLVDY